MSASLHNSLIHVAHQLVHSLPSPVLRVLDAWSLRVARRRALQRQLKWQQQKAATQANAAGAAVYHLKPWRD
ncbi:hypothetical protein [Ramlibacter alkalitolerans]|jgi:hypothetical protein|uniref:Uncharacterized protein n=1 Tax=Ramlibacter alkalitolerans TaxID=2039631 RepID=A0ABS1JT12_9BURK|nr:hypothetical protein [Ramlibacter alkalitolerans]MBL0427006.1 hypothetical protein [Ramlibacter alkalitolerans]